MGAWWSAEEAEVAAAATPAPSKISAPAPGCEEATTATGAALTHRLTLQAAMRAEGWRPYSKEWWHFHYPLEGTRPRDVPYACFEPPEGAWTPPPD